MTLHFTPIFMRPFQQGCYALHRSPNSCPKNNTKSPIFAEKPCTSHPNSAPNQNLEPPQTHRRFHAPPQTQHIATTPDLPALGDHTQSRKAIAPAFTTAPPQTQHIATTPDLPAFGGHTQSRKAIPPASTTRTTPDPAYRQHPRLTGVGRPHSISKGDRPGIHHPHHPRLSGALTDHQ
jgi:hypothetical protein